MLGQFLALRLRIFAGMITHYCATYEEALRRAKAAGKVPGCHYGGITLPSGKKAFAVYREGKVIERYSAMNITLERKNSREV